MTAKSSDPSDRPPVRIEVNREATEEDREEARSLVSEEELSDPSDRLVDPSDPLWFIPFWARVMMIAVPLLAVVVGRA